MKSMLRGRDRKVLALVLATLVLAGGFCIFDGEEHEDGHPGFDLCLGMLVTLSTLTLISRLPLAGLTVVDYLAPVVAFSLRVPAPPPKLTLS